MTDPQPDPLTVQRARLHRIAVEEHREFDQLDTDPNGDQLDARSD